MRHARPMFQHRHYAAIAGALADALAREGLDHPMAKAMHSRINLELCRVFGRDNGQFDFGRFERAAQGEPDGRDKI